MYSKLYVIDNLGLNMDVKINDNVAEVFWLCE